MSAEDVESYFRQMEMMENGGVAEEESAESVMQAEAAYLQNKLYIERADATHTRDKIESAALFHVCSSGCAWERLGIHQAFVHEGRMRKATSNVYVCRTSHKTHLCGSTRYCDQACVVGSMGSVVCLWTGYELDDRIYSLSRDREGPEVLVVGSLTLPMCATHREEGMTASQYENWMATRGLEGENKETPKLLRAARGQMAALDGDFEEVVLRTSPAEEQWRQLMVAARYEERHVTRVMALYPDLQGRELIARVEERATMQRVALQAFNVHVLTDAQNASIISEADKKVALWFKDMACYDRTCRERGETPSLLHKVVSFLEVIDPELKDVHYGGSLDAQHDQVRAGVLESLVRMWEQYVTAPMSGPSKFSECCAAMLKWMSKGFEIKVHVLPGSPKPWVYGDLTEDQKTTAQQHEITFIHKHPRLILASISTVRSSSHEVVRPQERRKKSRNSDHLNAFFAKTKKGGAQRHNASKKTSQYSQVIPPRKKLNAVVKDIVRHCESIEALRRYSTAVVCPDYCTFIS